MSAENHYDVLIIGAGAAGLMAALECALAGRKTAVIEARGRTGGRIHTTQPEGFPIPVEQGAEFVHGKLRLTLQLAKEAGIESVPAGGSIWRMDKTGLVQQEDFLEDYDLLEKKLSAVVEDIPVAQFLETNFPGDRYAALRKSLCNYVEGYNAATVEKASTLALRRELTTSDDRQYRLRGGYAGIIDQLRRNCSGKGVSIYLNEPVTSIHWSEHKVEVRARHKYSADALICTVPLGVLQQRRIAFDPLPSEQLQAIDQLGYGPVIKIGFSFTRSYWKDPAITGGKDLSDLGFIFSDEAVPTWWTQQQEDLPMLTGWLAGPKAAALQHLSEADLIVKGLHSLSLLFGTDVVHLQQLLCSAVVSKWTDDPFACGAYSFDVVGGAAQKQIAKQPARNTLFFAGEALHEGPEVGTVEAALQNGRETARLLISLHPLR